MGQKQKHARGVRFFLGFNMYLILAQCEQVYLFFALAQYYLFGWVRAAPPMNYSYMLQLGKQVEAN